MPQHVWFLALLAGMLACPGCARQPEQYVPPPDVVEPVQVTGGSPVAGQEIVLEGRFVYEKRSVVSVRAELTRPNKRGQPVIHNTAGGKAIDEGKGHYAYRLSLRCPREPGQYTLNIRVGRDYITTQKIWIEPAGKRTP